MTEVEVGIDIIEEDLVAIEEMVALGIEVDPPLGIKERRCHYCREPEQHKN